ncbi:MAG: hypothetical protein DSZ03_05195 [Sulfurimonas sp.]|nr:MAG: hypothetical protein DSZ03_05195 [Sulfurimonas sp.]
MNVLVVTAGYSIFDVKGQLNSFLAYLTERNLTEKGYKVKISDVTKDACDVIDLATIIGTKDFY